MNILEKMFSILGLAASTLQTCLPTLPHLAAPPHTEVSGPVISVFLSSAGFYPLYCYNSDVEHPGKRRESEVEGSGSEDTKTMA